MRKFTALLIANISLIIVTFIIAAAGPGGEVGMLPFIVLPYSGLISFMILGILSILYKKTVTHSFERFSLVLLIAVINFAEMFIFLFIG